MDQRLKDYLSRMPKAEVDPGILNELLEGMKQVADENARDPVKRHQMAMLYRFWAR